MTPTLSIAVPSKSAIEPPRQENDFYSQYTWCLDPYPTFREVLDHLVSEVESVYPVGDWRHEERATNIYLYLCALYCAAADFANPVHLKLPAGLKKVLPGSVLRLAEASVNLPAIGTSHRRSKRVRVALASLKQWIDWACRPILAFSPAAAPCDVRLFTRRLSALVPAALLERRMQIPEAFRCQDLNLADACSMARRVLENGLELKGTLVVGLRTAGGYFAPLIAAWIRDKASLEIDWISLRPKNGVTTSDFRAAVHANKQFIITDDHPNTGNTLRLALRILRSLNVGDRSIRVIVPEHPAKPGWTMPEEAAKGVRILCLPHVLRDKVRFLRSRKVTDTMCNYFQQAGWEDVTCHETEESFDINQEFVSRYGDGFQVRVKRVLDLRGTKKGQPVAARVLAKSVGTGWFGYHSYLIASRLRGSVPDILGLRHGFLFEQWIEGVSPGLVTVEALSEYISRRTIALRLQRDPSTSNSSCWSVWRELAFALRTVYGKFAGIAVTNALQLRLQRTYVTPTPAVLDGRMRPQEWIHSPDKLFKIDFEQHNFGGGELDLADPAFDLAGAAFEFQLDRDQIRALCNSYLECVADATLHQRLPLYRLLYALGIAKAAAYWLRSRRDGPDAQSYFLKLCDAKRVLMNLIAEHLSRHYRIPPARWTGSVLFLDVDGVLDWQVLPFSHTTPAGVAALQLLLKNGISVVLNTARSIKSVKDYCEIFGLPGGIAENGSVFWDAVQQREIPLVDDTCLTQISICRDSISKLSRILQDPDYGYSIRTCRWTETNTIPLADNEAKALADAAQLSYRTTTSDTWFGSRTASKASAARQILSLLPKPVEKTFSIGDSYADAELLRSTQHAYAPSNASAAIRRLAREGKCTQMRAALQKGLLQAAQEITGKRAPALPAPEDQLDELLAIVDRSTVGRLFAAACLGVIR